MSDEGATEGAAPASVSEDPADEVTAFRAAIPSLRERHGANALVVKPSAYDHPSGQRATAGGWADLAGEPAILPACLDVLVVVDGGETLGRDPGDVLALLGAHAERAQEPVAHHVVTVPDAERATLMDRIRALPEVELPKAEREAAPPPPVGPSSRRGPTRELRFGWLAAAVGLWSVLHWGALAAALWPFWDQAMTAGEAPPWWVPLATLVPDSVIGLVLAGLLLRRVRKVADGTTGRARVGLMASGALIRSAGVAGLAGVIAYALTDPSAFALGFLPDQGLMPVGSMPTLWDSLLTVAYAQGTAPVLFAAAGVAALGALFEIGGALASWVLLPRGFRDGYWLANDAVLVLGFVAVTLLLPIEPPEDAPDEVGLAATRLAVTAAAAIRLLFRALPPALDLIEGGGFRLVVAARMLRARKSGFLTVIGGLSIGAVALATCTLTTTLSVMGGFRNDLKQKILGNNAHVVVDKEHGTFEGWAPLLDRTRATDGVVAATPFLQGEVMITSATNLGGAVLRGIDPETIGDVTELPRNLRHGRMQYLSEPERLLRLRADEMRRGLLAPPMEGDDDAGERGSVFDDAEEVLDVAGADGADEVTDPDTARIREDIDEFLLPDARDGGGAPAGERADGGDEGLAGDAGDEAFEPDVLPGLIVGQELARTLRLHVGDEVNVVSPRGELGPTGPMPKSRPFRIAGIFYSGMYEFDMKMAYTTLEAAQGFLNVGDAISGIEVKVEDTDQAGPIAEAIAAAIDRPQLRVRSWQEVNRNLFGALQLEKLAMFITLGIAILVASFCIIGTLILMVQEKGKEVGILKAMGASSEQIVAVFMAQGLMIGLLGALSGLGLGYLTCFTAEHYGVGLNPEVYYIDRLPVHIDPTEFVLTGVAAVVVCLLATIYPAILGSRLRPVDALRFA